MGRSLQPIQILSKPGFADALLWNQMICCMDSGHLTNLPYLLMLVQVGWWRRRPLYCAVSDGVGWGYTTIWGWCTFTEVPYKHECFCRFIRRQSWLSMCSLDCPLHQASSAMGKTGLFRNHLLMDTNYWTYRMLSCPPHQILADLFSCWCLGLYTEEVPEDGVRCTRSMGTFSRYKIKPWWLVSTATPKKSYRE